MDPKQKTNKKMLEIPIRFYVNVQVVTKPKHEHSDTPQIYLDGVSAYNNSNLYISHVILAPSSSGQKYSRGPARHK